MWSWFSSILDVMSFSWTFCRYIRNRIEIASKCYVSSFKVDLLLYQAKFFFWNCDVYLGPDVALSDAYGGPRQTYDDDDDVNQYKDYQPETGNCTHQDLPCLIGWFDCYVVTVYGYWLVITALYLWIHSKCLQDNNLNYTLSCHFLAVT